MEKQYKISEPYNYVNDKEYSLNDSISFFDEIAKKIHWDKIYDQVYSGNELKPNWYAGGKLNVCYNILDVNALNNETKENIALIHECPILGISNKITYYELWKQVCIFSNALKHIGIKKGDRVMISMPNGIRVAIAMFACIRIGAIHCVITLDISSRINYFQPKLLITQDWGISYITSEYYDHSKLVLDALNCSSFKPELIIVNNRNDTLTTLNPLQIVKIENSLDWDHLIKGLEPMAEYEILDTNDQMFHVFTSGTTGDPKGLLFKSGEYAVMNSYMNTCMFSAKPGDVIFASYENSSKYCHNVSIYGLLKHGATSILYEGNHLLPNVNVIFDICSRNNVQTLIIFPRKIKNIQSIDPNGDSISSLNLNCLKSIIFLGEKYGDSIRLFEKIN